MKGRFAIGPNDTVKAKGKGDKETLPSKHALRKLTRGSPKDRSTLAFAMRTPSGAKAPATYRDIETMGVLGIDLKKG